MMKLALLVALISAPAFAEDAAPADGHGKATQHPDALAIDAACSAEAQTAGCGDEKVGTGLLKCIHAYKKAHRKDFHLSDACKAAIKKGHEDRKAHRAARGR